MQNPYLLFIALDRFDFLILLLGGDLYQLCLVLRHYFFLIFTAIQNTKNHVYDSTEERKKFSYDTVIIDPQIRIDHCRVIENIICEWHHAEDAYTARVFVINPCKIRSQIPKRDESDNQQRAASYEIFQCFTSGNVKCKYAKPVRRLAEEVRGENGCQRGHESFVIFHTQKQDQWKMRAEWIELPYRRFLKKDIRRNLKRTAHSADHEKAFHISGNVKSDSGKSTG